MGFGSWKKKMEGKEHFLLLFWWFFCDSSIGWLVCLSGFYHCFSVSGFYAYGVLVCLAHEKMEG